MHRRCFAVAAGAFVALTLTGPVAADTERAGAVGGAEQPSYPVRVIERPLTLPRAMVEPRLVLGYHRIDVGEESENLNEVAVGATVGIADKFSVGVVGGAIGGGERDYIKAGALFADYLIYDGAQLDSVLRMTLPMNFESAEDLVQELRLGLPSRFALHDMVALFFGDDFFAISSEGVVVPVNLGVGVQVLDPVWVRLDTTVATLSVSGAENDASMATLADIQTAQLRLSYAIGSALDISAIAMTERGDDIFDRIVVGAGVAARL
jgi:hypothetical protein